MVEEVVGPVRRNRKGNEFKTKGKATASKEATPKQAKKWTKLIVSPRSPSLAHCMNIFAFIDKRRDLMTRKVKKQTT